MEKKDFVDILFGILLYFPIPMGIFLIIHIFIVRLPTDLFVISALASFIAINYNNLIILREKVKGLKFGLYVIIFGIIFPLAGVFILLGIASIYSKDILTTQKIAGVLFGAFFGFCASYGSILMTSFFSRMLKKK